MIAVLVMVITISNTSTGEKLLEFSRDFSEQVFGNKTATCVEAAAAEAKKLALEYREQTGNEYISGNGTCHWELRSGQKA